MSRYRKEGKEKAYEIAQMYAAELSYSELMDPTTIHGWNHVVDNTRDDAVETLSDADIMDVAAKAIRVERGRRLGKSQTTKLSIDLHAADMDKLGRIRAEGNHSTKVAVIRSLIRNECDRLDVENSRGVDEGEKHAETGVPTSESEEKWRNA